MKVAVAIAGLMVLLAGCGEDGKELRAGSSDAEAGSMPGEWQSANLGPGSWDGARTSADGRELLLVLVGGPEYEEGNPCTVAYSARVTETETEARVEILSKSPAAVGDVACTAEGHYRTVELALDQPLGDRRLVDVQFERSMPVFDGSELVEPRWLPVGWELRTEGPGYPDPEAVSSWRRTWSGPERPPQDGRCSAGEAAVMLTQGSRGLVDNYPSNGEQPTRSHDVGGHTATYFEGGSAGVTRLSWTDGRRDFVLASMPGCVGDTPASEETLLRIAQSLAQPE